MPCLKNGSRGSRLCVLANRPTERGATRFYCPVRFMESLHDFDAVHLDHEPTPNPSQEGT